MRLVCENNHPTNPMQLALCFIRRPSVEVSWNNLKRQLCAAGKKWKINQDSMALSYPEPKVRWAAAVSFHLKLIVHAFKWWQNPWEWPSRAEALWGRCRGTKSVCVSWLGGSAQGEGDMGLKRSWPSPRRSGCGLWFIKGLAPGYRGPVWQRF